MGFGADLRAICERTKGRVDAVVRATALGLHGGMVDRSPVDTGRLRANFQVGFDAMDTTISPVGTEESAKARAQAELLKWRAGQTIYITNSLPYAVVSEYGLYGKPPGSANGPKTTGGYSNQAIGGFVRLTVQDFRRTLARAAKEASA